MRGKLSFTFGHAFAECKPSVRGSDTITPTSIQSSKSFRELFAKTCAINLIAAARVFMFGSRDVWFVVGLPVYLYGFGWQYMQVEETTRAAPRLTLSWTKHEHRSFGM